MITPETDREVEILNKNINYSKDIEIQKALTYLDNKYEELLYFQDIKKSKNKIILIDINGKSIEYIIGCDNF